MPFEQAFRLSSLLLAATAFVGLVLARSVPVWLALIGGTILILSLLQTWTFSLVRRSSRQVAISSGLGNLLLIGVFVLFLIDLVVISRELLPAGIHFLVMLLGIKLISLDQRRDFRHLYAISLMAILACAALTTDAWYIPIFLLYLLAAVWTLLLYHLTSDPAPYTSQAKSQNGQPRPAPQMGITSRFFWLTNGIAIVTVGLTLTVFFLLPRIGAGMLQKSRGEGLRTTGFSERVDLGMIGSVKQDPQVVMRVELPDLFAGGMDGLYLRGVAYDRYTSRSWSTSNLRRRSLGAFGDGAFVVRANGSRAPEGVFTPIQQDILLEALDTSVLFAVPFAEYVSGDFAGVQSDSMTALYLPSPTSSRIRYTVISRRYEIAQSERTASALDYPRSVLDRYLQLPELSERVVELSHQVVRQAATPYDRIMAIQQHLLRNYQYSLDVETTTSLHPLEDFLLTRKTGYCEHYATAMVIMLRAVGIPARLVTGFLATEWNEFGGYFTVRQQDAHAWVEVYFPRSGWITFDPTPAMGASPSRSSWNAFYRVSESLRLYWDRLFIRYSSRDQLAVIHGIRDGSDAVRDRFSQWISAVKGSALHAFSVLAQFARSATAGLSGVLGVLAVLGVLTLVVLVQKQMWPTNSPQHLAQQRQLQITRLYRTMLQTVAKTGLTKSPAATPAEFAGLVVRQWTAAGAMVIGVTDLYCRGRFSGMSLTAEELSRAEHQVRSLQQLSRTTV